MVFEEEPGIFLVAVNVEGDWWIDDFVKQWMMELKRNFESAYNSRRVYANALNIFLHYYIYIPQKKLQSLHDYLLQFREDLRKGFSLKSIRYITTKRHSFEKKYQVLDVKPLKVSTINSYMNAVQWYLSYLKEQGIDEIDGLHSHDIDWNELKRRSIHGKGGGYGLMMGPLLAQLLGPRKKFIRNLKMNRQSSKINSYFPPELFGDLLEISSPRERAIYLLCGGAGARIGQALSLTRDDYDIHSREVYIVDPLSDEQGPSGTLGRNRLLTEKYEINMEETTYKQLACKYPIPLQYTELLWIDIDHKNEFFSALVNVNKGNPIQNGHPFIFNTKSGKIVTPNEAYRTFRTKIKILQKKVHQEWLKKRSASKDDRERIDDEYKYLSKQLDNVEGLHSLRHMYGVMWADYAATTDYDLNDLQLLCQYGMGHKSKGSVMAYFTLRQKTRDKLMEQLSIANNIYFEKKIKEVKRYWERTK